METLKIKEQLSENELIEQMANRENYHRQHK